MSEACKCHAILSYLDTPAPISRQSTFSTKRELNIDKPLTIIVYHIFTYTDRPLGILKNLLLQKRTTSAVVGRIPSKYQKIYFGVTGFPNKNDACLYPGDG